MKIMIIIFSIVTLILIILFLAYYFSLKRLFIETLKDLEVPRLERKKAWKNNRGYILTFPWRKIR
jgi:hypothetical protein